MDEIHSFDKENHIVILPENKRMEDAISLYSESKSFCAEYLYLDNRGNLDGFIDHNKNMYLLNNEHDTRKTIWDKLFDTYETEDFKWTNQIYTSIASSLFKQLCGYLPESSYNANTKQMLDDFYPEALHWCTTDDRPNNLVNINICKLYPYMLLNNTQPIPVYSIHDVIEPFHC